MNLFVILVSALLIILGAITVVRAEQVAAAISRFYSKYPLIRLAGEQQTRLRKAYLIVVGIIFVAIGLSGLAMMV